MAERIPVKMSQFVQRMFCLGHEPFSIADYPYLDAIYDSPSRELGLFCGRQTSKSTTLASLLVGNAISKPKSTQILVSPLAEQSVEFSTSRLRDFIHDSPLVKEGFFTGSTVVDQVLRKTFSNGASIILGYAQRTADRMRGKSLTSGTGMSDADDLGSFLGFDEIQDIFPDVIPVLKEMAFRTKNPRFLFCGTPKSMNNHMEAMRRRGTGNEWAVRCEATGCKKWNMSWTERNIGDKGVVCEFCGAPLNTFKGEWVQRRRLDVEKGKDASVTIETFRLPQLIVRPIMTDKYKWVELLSKLKNYSTEKFRNEVLGLPFEGGSQPVTLEQLKACCVVDRPNVPPMVGAGNFPPLVMGVDWAFTAENSFTFVVIGAWNPFPSKFEVYYWKIYKGVDSDSHRQIDDIIHLYHTCSCRLIAADWGAGHVQNLSLIEALGEAHVAQVWHTGLRSKAGGRQRVKWDPKTRKWHLARTAVLTDTFEAIRRRQMAFPRPEECTTLFDHILAEGLEFNDNLNTCQYVNVDPDDGLHSLTYAMLAGELLVAGDFRGHAGSSPIFGGQSATTDVESAWGDDMMTASGY
jgi:hypothetical protein